MTLPASPTSLALAACLAAAAPSTVHAANVSIATYNIHHAAGVDNVVDVNRVATVLAALDADIIGLQENDIANRRTGMVDQPKALAARLSVLTGSSWVALAAPAINYQGGQYGNAVLYDTGVVSLQSFSVLGLPDPAGDGARSLGLAVFDLEGTRFQFGTTHLTNHNQASQTVPGSTVQIDSLNLIDARVDPSLPAIVNGDFNANASSATLLQWKALGWQIDSPIDQGTFHNSTQAIDFNTRQGADGWTVTGNRVYTAGEAQLASDHYPVVTTYAVAAIPEPSTYALMLGGAGLVGVWARRRRPA